ncbi:MAG: glycosyltransferase [Dermabacter sp.]|nr:glycosyltransferase [Dermabacter sp.]
MSAPQRSEVPLKGRRIASLVYNDAHNDARVLKSAASLATHGASVRIVATSRPAQGRGPGIEQRGPGVAIERLTAFTLDALVPFGAASVRTLLGIGASGTALRPAPASASSPAAPSATGDGPGADTGTGPDTRAGRRRERRGLATRARGAARALAVNAWGPASLTHYWALATATLVRERPSAILANDANTLVPAVIGGALTGAPVLYDSHELWRHRNVRPGRRVAPAVEALIERVGIARAAGVITVSDSIADWLQRTYRLPVRPSLVRNIPAAGPIPSPAEGQLRALAGLDDSARVVAYGGSITTSRGIEETLHALALMEPSTHLVMLGYGQEDYLAQLRALAESLGLGERVHVVGPVLPHEVTAALADGDVSVVHIRPTVLSYRFALPNKLFESIRAGLPIVAADLPDMARVVTSLGVGRTSALDDPADLARALTETMADADTYRAAARAAAAHLTWEAEADNLVDLVSAAINRRGRGGRA